MYNHTILVCIRAVIETETNSELLFSIRNTSYLNHYVYHGIEANKILHYQSPHTSFSKKITTYLDEKPQSRSAKKEITLGSSAGTHPRRGKTAPAVPRGL
jgi:hypothetical protein